MTKTKKGDSMDNNIYLMAYDLLEKGQRIVLARTIKRKGSAPRSVGSMCIITQTGKFIGTIGGGLMEYKVQSRAEKLFQTQESSIYQFHLTGENLSRAGMICGGDVDVYLEPLFPENKKTFLFFKTLRDHLLNNIQGFLVTLVQDKAKETDSRTRMFIPENDQSIGEIKNLDRLQLNLDTMSVPELLFIPDNGTQVFIEKVSLDPKVIIFGAGHISIFLSRLTKMVGFNITIVDDREEFANTKRFPDADHIIALPFEEAFEQLGDLKNSYVVIVTRGHLSDKDVLDFALKKDCHYIGMIGSRRKKMKIYEALLEEGHTKESLEMVRSPIGLSINAETPEEIAVSIISELIKERGTGKKLVKLM
jgi:xanthine dehydrogenase accessory factor